MSFAPGLSSLQCYLGEKNPTEHDPFIVYVGVVIYLIFWVKARNEHFTAFPTILAFLGFQ